MHHPALPAADVGAFMLRLREAEQWAPVRWNLPILTAARSGEVRGAVWSELDIPAKVWTVPADRMKAEKEHRVPLSADALALLAALPAVDAGTDYVFPAPRLGMLSDMTLTAVLPQVESASCAAWVPFHVPRLGSRAHGIPE